MAVAHYSLNPFPGLRSFEPEESGLFFGRERQIDELIVRLDDTRFLAVVGTSGCGKSSLVRAGLLPTLSKGHPGQAGSAWRTLLFKPGNNPHRNFCEALMGADEVTGEVPDLDITLDEVEAEMRARPKGLVDVAMKYHGRDRNLLVVVDQFEELFSYHSNDDQDRTTEDAQTFVNHLLKGILQSRVPIYIVLTMRSDFLGNCTEFEGLTEAINNGQFLIPKMTFEERKAAVVGPLKVANGKITDRLLDRILREAGEGQDQLPILQHTLMRMWDYWKQQRLTDQPMDYHEYEAVGGIENALSLHAEEAYAELDTDRQRRLAEILFKALTDLGADNRGTRRPTPLNEICALAEAEEHEVIEVAEIFRTHGRAFLMPPNRIPLGAEVALDISHESLMRKWVRLRIWVEEEIKSAELYLRLCNSAALFQEGKAGLMGNPELQLGLNWRQQNKPNLTWASRYDVNFERAINFLDHSEKAYNRAVLIKENRQKRELKRAKRFTLILGMASIVSLLFLLLAFNLKFKADDSRRMAEKQANLAEQQSAEALEQTKEALAQKRISEQQQEIAAQQRVIAEQNRNLALEQSEIALQNEAIANQQRAIAQANEKEAVQARNLAEENEQKAVEARNEAEENRLKAERSKAETERLRLQAVARNIAITAYNLDKKEQPELVKLLARQAYQFNADNGGTALDPDIYKALVYATEDEQVNREHGDAVRDLAYAAQGTAMVSGAENGEVIYWTGKELTTPTPLRNKEKDGSIRSVAINKNGAWVAAGHYKGQVHLWKNGQPSTHQALNVHQAIVSAMVFHPQLDYLFTASADSTLQSIDLNNPNGLPKLVSKLDGRVDALAISANGSFMAVGSRSGQFRIFDLQLGGSKVLYTGRSPSGGIASLAFSADGAALAIGTLNGKVLLYTTDNPTDSPLQLAGHLSPVSDLAYHPKKNQLLSASLDGSVKLWNLEETEAEPIVITQLDNWVWSVVFDAAGSRVAIGGQDRSIRWQTAASEQLVPQLCPALSRNLTQEEWDRYVGADIEYNSTCTGLPTGDLNTNQQEHEK